MKFICPNCEAKLRIPPSAKKVKCLKCKKSFEVTNGTPLLFWPNEQNFKGDVTQIVKAFYEKTPFPNYESIDSIWTLRNKATRGIFARLLDEQIPTGASILEVGCGTGQMSNFLGSRGKRKVYATDICLNSLMLGNQFRKKTKIKSVTFFQMNLFKPIFEPESFDYVICSGVLHHTGNPFEGYKTISKLVKPGGYIVIGLYNRYGRIPTDLRRVIFKLFGKKLTSLDPFMRLKDVEQIKKDTWFLDQYKNPHESKHTIDEVLGWFKETGFEFMNGIPKISLSSPFLEDEKLFEPSPRGNRLDHLLIQLGIAFNPGIDNGYFIMIGRKVE